ncbi:MAG: hypothetical protein ABSB88_06010 [Bryobacteraceae bacterium]|jgi:hypothetical protein
MLRTINTYIIDGLSTVMLLFFAAAATVRVYAMAASAIRRALRPDAEGKE